ncbi:MAG: LptF/LptG family permease [Candidatus Marinimicrobia bacterium]|nr:LptF/LptG family permease [Candidatus Neomarinimicrobiota bacterium]MCF7828884.1 LptF/LptG family permease [Candidatus Neomarinimicrobiota bacterium]MCF7880802.1 LptF/LptG family permease [Candidatus Neomarinimicrobiota bacterium]
MKILTRYILKEHLPPFVIAMGVLTFLFLANFIVKSIDRILGKGISFWIIAEYIFLNLMWILALSIPMAVLVAILMSYGRMSADNEINAMRTSGISFFTIIKPSLVFGIIVCLGLIYFNNNILPDFNHKARLLGSDIYRKKPDLSIEPGYFITDLPQYSLLVKDKKDGRLMDVLIYSKNNQNSEVQTTIKAEQGSLAVEGDKIVMTLFNGEIHELDTKEFSEYRRIDFSKHVLTIPAKGMVLERHEAGRRGDREMSSKMMLDRVAGVREKYQKTQEQITENLREKLHLDISADQTGRIKKLLNLPQDSVIAMLPDSIKDNASEMRRARRDVRVGLQRISTQRNLAQSYKRQINKYLVEVHKKYSIPVACIVFVLIGAPLGIMARHGGLAVGAGFSLLFFLVYWAGLIGGEELADRLIVSPWIAMWTPNMVVGLFGVFLTIRTVRERSSLDWSWLVKLRRQGKSDEDTNE